MDIKLYNRIDSLLNDVNASIRIHSFIKEGRTIYHVVVLGKTFGRSDIDGTYDMLPDQNKILFDVQANSHDEIIAKITELINERYKNAQAETRRTSIKSIDYKPSELFNNENGIVDVNVNMTIRVAVEPTTGNTYVDEASLLNDIYAYIGTLGAINTKVETKLGTTIQVFELMENGIKVPPVKIEKIR